MKSTGIELILIKSKNDYILAKKELWPGTSSIYKKGITSYLCEGSLGE